MKRKLVITLFSLIAIAAFWFLGVDCSWFVADCPDCLAGRDILQYRVFTIPVYERTQDDSTALQEIAVDIGAECKHPKLQRWHKHRYWGLVICAYPCINGTSRLSGSHEWYDDKARSIVKDMARTNPSLRDEFAERVLKNHDWQYYRAFCERMTAMRDEKPAFAQ